MPEVTSSVQAHYGSESIVDRMLAALATAGHDVSKPTVDMLNLIDQLHTGGLNSMKTQAELVGMTGSMRVLDARCGVGGSSRYLAHNYGCPVEAIDLTPQYVEAAVKLNKLCGMDDKITVREGSVTDLPYADRTFDLVWSQNVSMNVEDKRRMFSEAFRVLVPGGRFTLSHAAHGPAGDPYYPLPWARDQSYSFLGTPEEILDLLLEVGFSQVQNRDETGKLAGASGRGSGDLDVSAISGEDIAERQANSARSAHDGRLVRMLVVAQRA